MTVNAALLSHVDGSGFELGFVGDDGRPVRSPIGALLEPAVRRCSSGPRILVVQGAEELHWTVVVRDVTAACGFESWLERLSSRNFVPCRSVLIRQLTIHTTTTAVQ